jgi:hypothetical protein
MEFNQMNDTLYFIFPEENNTKNSYKTKRCLICGKILLLNIIFKKDSIYIEYNCSNNHKGNISLKDYLNSNFKNSILKECKTCHFPLDKKKFFCLKCNEFICQECKKYHSIKNHIQIKKNDFDSICLEHNLIYNKYCLNCKNNLCEKCYENHSKHNTINLSDYNINEKEFQNIIVKLADLKYSLVEIEDMKKEIIKVLENMKNITLLEIQFFNEMLFIYENEKKKNNLNYEIIHNFKEIQFELNKNVLFNNNELLIKMKEFYNCCMENYYNDFLNKNQSYEPNVYYNFVNFKKDDIKNLSEQKGLINLIVENDEIQKKQLFTPSEKKKIKFNLSNYEELINQKEISSIIENNE